MADRNVCPTFTRVKEIALPVSPVHGVSRCEASAVFSRLE